MDLSGTPYFAALRQRLAAAGERQRLIAENLANASTPRFTPRDLDPKAVVRSVEAVASGRATGGVAVVRTHPGHMAPSAPANPALRAKDTPDSETTIDGNSVVLEEQLLKAGENRAAFDLGLSLYQKGLQLVRMAARPPR